MPLSDVKVRKAKPGEKQVKLTDSDGMYLLVTPQGGKCWCLKYRFGGKEKVLALGAYPEVSLSAARDKRKEARELLAAGIDPGEARKAQKSARTESATNSFEVIAREWHNRFSPTWTEMYAERVLDRLQRDAFPWIGARPIAEIKAPDVLAVLRRVESRGALRSEGDTIKAADR